MEFESYKLGDERDYLKANYQLKQHDNMSLLVRKPVFLVFYKTTEKPASLTTETIC